MANKPIRVKRAKPPNADYYGWAAFDKLADQCGYSYAEEEWERIWEFWRKGYIAGVNNA